MEEAKSELNRIGEKRNAFPPPNKVFVEKPLLFIFSPLPRGVQINTLKLVRCFFPTLFEPRFGLSWF
jgi:hypothetical protein